MVETFHRSGKYPMESEALYISARESMAMSGRFWRIVLLMPLRPGQVFFVCLMVLLISSLVTGVVRWAALSLSGSACW